LLNLLEIHKQVECSTERVAKGHSTLQVGPVP
jgi:hypothetical protein